MLPDGWKADVLDISATGMRVRTLAVLPTGLELETRLRLEDGSMMPLRAVVVWAASPEEAGPGQHEFGLELVNPSQDFLEVLAHLFATTA